MLSMMMIVNSKDEVRIWNWEYQSSPVDRVNNINFFFPIYHAWIFYQSFVEPWDLFT